MTDNNTVLVGLEMKEIYGDQNGSSKNHRCDFLHVFKITLEVDK